MTNLSDRRLFGMCVLSALGGVVIYATVGHSYGGGVVLVAAIGLLAVMMFVDGYLSVSNNRN